MSIRTLCGTKQSNSLRFTESQSLLRAETQSPDLRLQINLGLKKCSARFYILKSCRIQKEILGGGWREINGEASIVGRWSLKSAPSLRDACGGSCGHVLRPQDQGV